MEINQSDIKKILIIQCNHFGDVLLNTGYLPFLREKFPDARIDFLVSRPFHTIVEHNPNIDELILYDKNLKGVAYIMERIRLIREVRQRRYDLVMDQNRATRSAQIVLFSGAPYRLGFRNFIWRFVYNIKATPGPARYSASAKFDLLAPLGICEQPYHLHYYVEPESFHFIDQWIKENHLESADRICIAPGTPSAKKKWRTKNFAELADMLADRCGVDIVILGAPGERQVMEEMKNLMKSTAHVAPKISFNQAGALLKRSRLLICNDGGLNHLSVALDTPSLAVFGNTKPIDWSPDLFPGHVTLYNPDHASGKDDSFGISPEEAFRSAKLLLKTGGGNKKI